jgi:hypothetical protein
VKLLLNFFLIFITVSCSSVKTPKEGKTNYSQVDASGSFKLVRESKMIQNKLVTRNQLASTKGGATRVLEKSVLVSQMGSIKSNRGRLFTVRPFASEFTIWLEGQKYTSKMKLDTRSKSMKVTLTSPEKKWQGEKLYPFPKGRIFCFYNQLPECLYQNHLLMNAKDRDNQKFDFYIIWDGYPFIQDLLTRVGRNLFAPASIKFDGANDGLFRYIVEVEGQVIMYQFSKSFDFVKLAWVSQGITIAPPGQDIVEDE